MIYILDEKLKIVDILRKYNFAQYNNRFRDIGAFKINAQLIDENIYILDETKQYYVLFDFDEYIFGQVTKVKQSGEGDNDKEIVIEGKLSKYILTKRVINGTINYKGKTFGLVKEIIDSNIVSSSNVKRNLPIEIIYDEEYLTSVCSDVTKQITGGYVWEEAEKLLTQDNLGIDFVPNIITDSNTTNIDKWYLTINAGVDRTKENKYGNNPVIFSQQLSNIASVDYERDVEEYTNYAYVAGEGEEENRKWYEINRTDKDASGWNRKELWIDARDVQSENKDGTILSETEYEKLIKERANEKFSESDVQESYEATLTENNAQYTYGIDYNLGDWCTVTDINLNKELDVQITEITVTVQGTRKIVDVGFTYGLIKKDPIKQTQQNTNEIQRISNNIKYIEGKVSNSLMPIGSVVMNVLKTFDPAKLYGGVWERIKGRTLVGVDEEDEDFKEAGLELGEKTHTLTKAEVPNATGSLQMHGAGSGGTNMQTTTGVFTSGLAVNGYSYYANAGAWSVGMVKFDLGFGDGAHNNIQPSYTVYMWVRIA